jgi:hypothetical protein
MPEWQFVRVLYFQKRHDDIAQTVNGNEIIQVHLTFDELFAGENLVMHHFIDFSEHPWIALHLFS